MATTKKVSNPAAALGQEVGKLIEDALVGSLRLAMKVYGHTIGPERMKNGTDNVFQIDAVVRDDKGNPVILLDPKYIRYKKHNRDKGSWLCVAHYNLRKTYPSIRKSIAVLAGNWSGTSVDLIKSFGIETLGIPFAHIRKVVADYGIEFDWDEKDRETPRESFETYLGLEQEQKKDIAERLIEPVKKALEDSVIDVIQTTIADQRIKQIELLLKTDSDQMLLLQYESVAKALEGMAGFVSDRRDIRVFLENGIGD
ncbi:MAG: hypothetical protein OXF31_01115 [Gammaproteobacteria bacterium]|nr:hypothetical protein [Gammaproteobacteria bacterium]